MKTVMLALFLVACSVEPDGQDEIQQEQTFDPHVPGNENCPTPTDTGTKWQCNVSLVVVSRDGQICVLRATGFYNYVGIGTNKPTYRTEALACSNGTTAAKAELDRLFPACGPLLPACSCMSVP